MRSVKGKRNISDFTNPMFNYFTKLLSNLIGKQPKTDDLSSLATKYLDQSLLKQEIFRFKDDQETKVSTEFTFEEKVINRFIASSFLLTLNSTGLNENEAAKLTLSIITTYKRQFQNFLPETNVDITSGYECVKQFFQGSETEFNIILNTAKYVDEFGISHDTLKQSLFEVAKDKSKIPLNEFLSTVISRSSIKNTNQSMDFVLNTIPPPFDFHTEEIYLELYNECAGEKNHLVHYNNKCLVLSDKINQNKVIGKQLTPLNFKFNSEKRSSFQNSKFVSPKYFDNLDFIETENKKIEEIDDKLESLLHRGYLKEYLLLPISENETLVLYSYSDLIPLNSMRGVVL